MGDDVQADSSGIADNFGVGGSSGLGPYSQSGGGYTPDVGVITMTPTTDESGFPIDTGTSPDYLTYDPFSDPTSILGIGAVGISGDPTAVGGCDEVIDPFCNFDFASACASGDAASCVALDGVSSGSGYASDMASWCNDNPLLCDGNGMINANDPSSIEKFCADQPYNCVDNPDGTTAINTRAVAPKTSGGGSSGGTSGGSGGATSGGGKSSGASGSTAKDPISQIASLLGNFLKALTGSSGASTPCPAGYAKNAQGTCVKSTVPSAGSSTGLLAGFGGNNLIYVIGGVLLIVYFVKRKG